MFDVSRKRKHQQNLGSITWTRVLQWPTRVPCLVRDQLNLLYADGLGMAIRRCLMAFGIKLRWLGSWIRDDNILLETFVWESLFVLVSRYYDGSQAFKQNKVLLFFGVLPVFPRHSFKVWRVGHWNTIDIRIAWKSMTSLHSSLRKQSHPQIWKDWIHHLSFQFFHSFQT